MPEEASKKKPMSTARTLLFATVGAIVILIITIVALGSTSEEDRELSARQAVEASLITLSLESHRDEHGIYPRSIDSYVDRDGSIAQIDEWDYSTNSDNSEFVFRYTRADGSEHEIRNEEWDD